ADAALRHCPARSRDHRRGRTRPWPRRAGCRVHSRTPRDSCESGAGTAIRIRTINTELTEHTEKTIRLSVVSVGSVFVLDVVLPKCQIEPSADSELRRRGRGQNARDAV